MIGSAFFKFIFHFSLFYFFYFLFSLNIFAQDIVWKKSFGSYGNIYNSIITVSDGVVAAGVGGCFNYGDWEGVAGKGGSDAIIVKYNFNGNVIWKKNFGGEAYDKYFSVTEVPDGIVAVGYSMSQSFNTGDWIGTTNKGNRDAIVVKYDRNGNVVWKRNFGGRHTNEFLSISAVPEGVIAVGWSSEGSFDNGDWEGVMGKGNYDAIIVKYDHNGNLVWKKSFGGNSSDYFLSVTSHSDGIIVVGYSSGGSFGNGDWEGINGKGGSDAIIVKYDFNGNVVWKKNFGGNSSESFRAVIATSGGFVAVGTTWSHFFDNDDWEDFTAKGLCDALIVKFDFSGNVIWKNNFGGNGTDYYSSVTEVSDGFVAVGGGLNFNTGDWEGIEGYGDIDAIIVKYDKEGNVIWKKNFGGRSIDTYESVTTTFNSVVAVGYSYCDSFGSGDWEDIDCRGQAMDAIIVKYANGEVGIAERELFEIRVYPNPTNGELRIENGEWRMERVEVFDIYGRKVLEPPLTVLRSYDLTVLPAGIYFLKIATDKGVVVKKVVKQ